ncbi:Tat pathway signal protein [Sphingomonas glacialis]|uniref:Tat pathway signal protein n=1 Tax=Sphingomonas glacialis TaxID=658225 RepID=A0ABQ3LUR1_9SPHN|nr:nitroreductase family protein [Sphingomonas glacialis]GHH26647.1 Tat pathway signal protein [Sphingomonas glacialis]
MNRRTLLIGGGAATVAVAGAGWIGLHGMGSMSAYDASVAASRAALGANPGYRALVRFATLAPNGHNTQPWRFRIATDRITVLPDFARRTPVVDPDDHHIFVSLGCAAENLMLAAAASGHSAEPEFASKNGGAIELRFRPARPLDSALCDAIPQRQSTRGDYDGKPLSTAELQMLATAAEVPDVETVLITQRADIDRVRDLVLTGNTAQMADAAFVRELKQWLRFNPHDATRSGDGLFSVASGNPSLPSWAGPLLFDRMVTAASENDRYARQLRSSAGVAVFVGAAADPAHWVGVGRACQRFGLQATALGLKCAFVNQPVEVPGLRPELASLIGIAGQRPDIVMRFGHGPPLPFSARRPVSAVLA